jgi:hypothetical protein
MMKLQARLMRHEIIPFSLYMGLLVLVTLLADAALHLLTSCGSAATSAFPACPADHRVVRLLDAQTQAHHLRPIRTLLRWHEGLAWLGSLLVLVHAGIHFNAILGWLAVGRC